MFSIFLYLDMASFAIYFADCGDTGASVYVSLNLVIKLSSFKFPNEETDTHIHITVSLSFPNLNTY